MFSPNSSYDDRNFFNPMNSLSLDEADLTPTPQLPKNSLISENPPILAKRTDSLVDKSTEKKIAFKIDSPDNYKEVKLPTEQSFNYLTAQPSQSNLKTPQPQQQLSQYAKSIKITDSQNKPSPVGNSLSDDLPQSSSGRRKLRIFDPIAEDKLEQSSFLIEINKMIGDEAIKRNIEPKDIKTPEDLIIQRQMFLHTNFTEKNLQIYIDKATTQLQKMEEQKKILDSLTILNDKVNHILPFCFKQEHCLIDEVSEQKRIEQSKRDFQILYFQIMKMEVPLRIEQGQECETLIEQLQPEMDLVYKLQFAIQNLQKLKQCLDLVKNTSNFQKEFQAYLDLIKKSQKFETEMLKPQIVTIQSALKYKVNNMMNQINEQSQ